MRYILDSSFVNDDKGHCIIVNTAKKESNQPVDNCTNTIDA